MVWSPAGTSCSMELSSHTLVPLTKTAPPSEDTVPDRRTDPRSWPASARAAASWRLAEHTDTQAGRSLSLGQVSEVFCTQNDTSGGSSETGTNVDAARPDPHAVDLGGDRRSHRTGSDRTPHAATAGRQPWIRRARVRTAAHTRLEPTLQRPNRHRERTSPLSNLTPCPNVSILSVLRERAGLQPDDIAFTFTDYDPDLGRRLREPDLVAGVPADTQCAPTRSAGTDRRATGH